MTESSKEILSKAWEFPSVHWLGCFAVKLRKEDERNMFSTFGGFFAVYIPLVILAIIGVIKEEKLIAFEQKIKNRMRANHGKHR